MVKGGDPTTDNYVAHSLRADGFDASEDGTGRGTPPVVDTLVSNGDAHSGFRDEKGLVVAFAHQQGGSVDLHTSENCGLTVQRCQTQAVAFDTTQITSKANHGNPKPGDPCHPLAAGAHPPAVALEQVAQPIRSNPHNNSDPGMEARMHVMQGMAVRRLTPRECERLQGFRDNYTRIPVRRSKRAPKPAKLAKYPDLYELGADGVWTLFAADGPRYKALGNSMAVNCMSWIGQRIAIADTVPQK